MLATDTLDDLGVRLGPDGGTLRVHSGSATSIEICLHDDKDPAWVSATLPLQRDADGTFSVTTPLLKAGTRYTLRADGPDRAFDPTVPLLDPYARGLARTEDGGWQGYVPADDGFDWGGVRRPGIPLESSVIYEAHVKGMTRARADLPEELRGTYAGLAHESTVAYLKDLGVTAVQLLPVHQSVSEQRLLKQGLANYWGYNTLNFFAPHSAYATRQAQQAGADAVLREFKGMVRLLHEAGLEVLLDVVYNHTAEEGPLGPTTSLRGLDDAGYYRRTATGDYIDVTGCGNSLDTSSPQAARLVLDSLRYWAEEVQVDGFRFDLAATLARGADHSFDPEHPLLAAIQDDPALEGVKLIAEPWDVGLGGWQVGGFPRGWSEWNDGYRDRVRDFWLGDVASARAHGQAPNGIGSLARRLSGSAHVFSADRGPLAAVNFVTAHDGFTLADLVSYDVKHNQGNGEQGRDGNDHNRSWNHGVEGPTDDAAVTAARQQTLRSMLGTLLLSAGIPLLTAGDEYGRSQRGNNNAYNQDSELTWLSWEREPWQRQLTDVTRRLLRLRRENPALRPTRFAEDGEAVPGASSMLWFGKDGGEMADADWDSPAARTLQYLASSTGEHEEFNRVLLVIHGLDEALTVTLPPHVDVAHYELLWSSADDALGGEVFSPGDPLPVAGLSLTLLKAG